MYFVKCFSRGIVERHSVNDRVLAHNGARVKVETAAVSDHRDPAKYAKRVEIFLQIDMCRHFNYYVGSFAAREVLDFGKMTVIAMIENMISSLFHDQLLAIGGARSEERRVGKECRYGEWR